MKINGIGHVAFRCRHFQETMDFYIQVLGGKKTFDLKDEEGRVYLTYVEIAPGQFLELFPADYEGDNLAQERSFLHICVEIDDFAKTVEALRAAGAVVTVAGRDTPALTEDPTARTPGQCGSLCAFVTDPEGNDVELMQFTENSMQLKGGPFHV